MANFQKEKQNSLESVLYKPKEHEHSPFLDLTSVTHADALLEAKVNTFTSHTWLGVGVGGRHHRDGAASEKYTQNLESLVKSTSYFLRHQTVSITKRKKGEKKILTGSALTTYADCNKIWAKLIQGNKNHLAYR